MRRRLILVGLLLVVGAALPAVVALLRAAPTARAAAAEARRAMAAVEQADPAQAARHFRRASTLFATARRRLDGSFVSVGMAVPVVRQNVAAARDLTAAGSRLAAVGSDLAADVDADRLRVEGGTVPIGELEGMAPVLEQSARDLRRAAADLAGLESPVLLPLLGGAVDEGATRVDEASDRVELLREVVRVLPGVLGRDGPRRYFLAVQNNSEARPTGGFIGSFGELVAEGGRIRLERFDRISQLNAGGPGPRLLPAGEYQRRYGRFEPERTWQNVNLSPDFPTVASVIADLYPQSGGSRVDGVIAVDPPGLAALLRLTGPVAVPGWPEPLTADNAVDVLLHEAYLALPNPDRVEFLGDAAEAVWDRLLSVELGTSRSILDALAPAVEGGNLKVWLAAPAEQRLPLRAGVDGAVPDVAGDALLVTTSNAGANKIDWFLHRRVRYDVELRPTEGGADVDAHLDVALENQAPPGGLPPYVIGPSPAVPGARAGENRAYVSVYSPLAFDGARLDGVPVALESAAELGRSVYSTFLTVPPRSTRTLSIDLDGRVDLRRGGWYELDLGRQPVLHPDRATVQLRVPAGYRIAEVRGIDAPAGGERLRGDLVVSGATRVRVRLVAAGT